MAVEDLAGGGGPAPAATGDTRTGGIRHTAPAAVITSAPAGVTGGAHQEQTYLNKDSSSGANLRCAGCHCRERAPGAG